MHEATDGTCAYRKDLRVDILRARHDIILAVLHTGISHTGRYI